MHFISLKFFVLCCDFYESIQTFKFIVFDKLFTKHKKPVGDIYISSDIGDSSFKLTIIFSIPEEEGF